MEDYNYINSEYARLMDEMNCIRLKDIENIKIGSLLYFYFENLQFGVQNNWSVIKNFIWIIARTFTIRTEMEGDVSAEKWFYCSRPLAAYRPDHLENMRKVSNVIESYFMVWETNRVRLSFFKVKYILCMMNWNHQLKKLLTDRNMRWTVLRTIYSARLDCLDMQHLAKGGRPKVLTVMEETTPSSQFIINWAKQNGCKTVVLQHGFYQKTNKLSYYLQNGICDYMVLYSKAQEKIVQACGGYVGQVKCLGMHQFVDMTSPSLDSGVENKNTIGVFLNPSLARREENKRLLSLVNLACLNVGMDIIVKLHPSDSNNDEHFYQQFIDEKLLKKIICKEETSLQIMKQIDVMVCVESTSYLESVSQKIASFLYVDCEWKGERAFNELPYDVYFDNEEKLERLILSRNDTIRKKEIECLREYLCGSQDPREEYKHFFEAIC